MENQLPSIFGYNNFRNYLIDYQKARQKWEPEFSKSEFSRLLQLPNTRSYLTDVLKGKRVTPTFSERFISVMNLDKDEALFFRTLIKFNQAESTDEREVYFEQLISLNRSSKKVIDLSHYTYYKNWYNSVIRALLNIIDWKSNYTELAKRVFPAITPKQAEESIKLLLKLGLIEQNSSGFFKPTQASITTSEYVRDEMIKQYQLNCLEVSKTIIMKGTEKKFATSTNIISISEQGLERLEKKIQKFRSEVRSLVQKDENIPDRIYHLDILLIPNSN